MRTVGRRAHPFTPTSASAFYCIAGCSQSLLSQQACSTFEATDVLRQNSPMSLPSACRGSTTAPPVPSSQPSSEGQPRPTCDELKERSTPAYNPIPRPLLEFMAFSRADVQLVSEPTTTPQDRHEVANKPVGRAARNRDTVEVWLLGHRSTTPNLHRSEFEDRTRGDVSANLRPASLTIY